MKLFIPNRINVGFQKREGTYTGKLAYIIYFDQKDVLRKERSWQGWRDKSIDPIQFENKPMDGFVLNKGVGGARASYGWNARNEYIRIYDPRDFEFEISVANLLFILRENDCMKGKGLTGQYVYGWDGTELVLLPTNCEDYKESVQFTNAQAKNMSLRDLRVGHSYRMKDLSVITYIGKHKFYKYNEDWRERSLSYGGIFHIIYDGNGFQVLKNAKNLSEEIEESGEYADLVEKYYNSIYADAPDVFIVDGVEQDRCSSIYCDSLNDQYYKSISYYNLFIEDNRIRSKHETIYSNSYDTASLKDLTTAFVHKIRYLDNKTKLRLKNGKIFTVRKGNIERYCDEQR